MEKTVMSSAYKKICFCSRTQTGMLNKPNLIEELEGSTAENKAKFLRQCENGTLKGISERLPYGAIFMLMSPDGSTHPELIYAP